ncbi:MAG: manganese efflux pump [Bacteroidales bacterium]|nr:manganese efflux pump [Candidatus Colimorpha merdihippi]
MSLTEAFVLAMALCVDSLVVSTTSAFRSKMPYRTGLLMALVFGFMQGAFPLLGALLGSAFKQVVESIDHWVAFGLLLIVGGKMIWDAFHANDEDKQLDVTRFGIMCLLGMATSIDAFVVGIGFGLNSTLKEIFMAVLVIFIVTFLVSILGIFLGKRNVPVPEKTATFLAGLVLISLGTYTLLEHLLA